MKHGAECVSNNLAGLGLPTDSCLILQEGSLLLGEVEVNIDCGCLLRNPRNSSSVLVTSTLIILLLEERFLSQEFVNIGLFSGTVHLKLHAELKSVR